MTAVAGSIVLSMSRMEPGGDTLARVTSKCYCVAELERGVNSLQTRNHTVCWKSSTDVKVADTV